MAAVIKPCECTSTFQDKEYGKNQRVHSEKKEGKAFKCTNCGKIKTK